MSCYRPVKGWRSREPNYNGKYYWTQKPKEAHTDRPLSVRCGSCVGCRSDRARDWSVRCMHEAQLHEQNSFITLTYDDDHLPSDRSLVKKHFQDFMKRLRQYVWRQHSIKIRTFYCGEYGSRGGRPHYHALIFGFGFPDKKHFKGDLFQSRALDDLWPYGFSSIGGVTYGSARYVASYVNKKLTPKVLAGRLPEFCGMSRRPGVGSGWLSRFKKGVLRKGTVVLEGSERRSPRYYEKQLESVEPSKVHSIKVQRVRAAYKDRVNSTPERLRDREVVDLAKINLYKGSL